MGMCLEKRVSISDWIHVGGFVLSLHRAFGGELELFALCRMALGSVHLHLKDSLPKQPKPKV